MKKILNSLRNTSTSLSDALLKNCSGNIKYKDLKGLISCFESIIPLSRISLCNFGPNLIHVKSTDTKIPKTKDDRKILKNQVDLILSSLNSKYKKEIDKFVENYYKNRLAKNEINEENLERLKKRKY